MTTRLAAAFIAFGLAGSGCTVDDHASVQIFAVCAPPEDATLCGFDGACDRLLASDRPFVVSQVDFGLGPAANQLEMFVQFDNQMPDNADPSSGRVNTNDFVLEDYQISLSGPLGAAGTFVHPANATVPAESSFVPVVPIIPAVAMPFVAAQIPPGTTGLAVAEVVARGRFLDGSHHETGPFRVAVNVFNGVFDVLTDLVCPKPGEVVTAVCPNVGQTSSITCEAP